MKDRLPGGNMNSDVTTLLSTHLCPHSACFLALRLEATLLSVQIQIVRGLDRSIGIAAPISLALRFPCRGKSHFWSIPSCSDQL